MIVVGVDGCRGGWVAMRWDTDAPTIAPSIHPTLAGLFDAYPDADAIGIDIPIGLSDTGTRRADIEARRLLGRPRSAAVFPAPCRAVLGVETYPEALARSMKSCRKGISLQAFHILPKIAEADALITPEMQERVVEVHPEVSFHTLAGRSLAHRKHRQPGYDERRALLEDAMGVELPERPQAFAWKRPAKPDDLLDAAVAAWTARRVAEGCAQRLPGTPERDARGLRMEIVR